MGRSSREIDWEGVERDYRMGQLTLRQIAVKFGIALSAVARHAKKGGWSRDLSDAVRACTSAKVMSALAEEAKKRDASEEQVTFSEVDLAANLNATIILGQQRRVSRQNQLLEKLISQLEKVTSERDSLETVGQTVSRTNTSSDQAVGQLLTLRERVLMLKDAATITTTLNTEERKIFRLDGERPELDSSIESLLAAMRSDPLSLEIDA